MNNDWSNEATTFKIGLKNLSFNISNVKLKSGQRYRSKIVIPIYCHLFDDVKILEIKDKHYFTDGSFELYNIIGKSDYKDGRLLLRKRAVHAFIEHHCNIIEKFLKDLTPYDLDVKITDENYNDENFTKYKEVPHSGFYKDDEKYLYTFSHWTCFYLEMYLTHR